MANVSDQSGCIIKRINVQKEKVCKKKNLSWVWGVDRKNPSHGNTVWHPRDARQWSSGRIFLSTPHTHDPYSTEDV